MEISKTNFTEKIPEISKTIKECSFISFDCEFSGLSTENNIFAFNYPEEVYLKHLKNSSEFIIVQLGLSFFKIEKLTEDEMEEKLDEDPEKNLNKDTKVTCATYNFYVFPQRSGATFMVQSESFMFLSNNDFDFNKLFKYGLSYCNQLEEEKMRQDLKEKQELRVETIKARASTEPCSTTNHIPVPDCEKAFLSGIESQITKYLETKENELEISNCNGFQRRLVYEMIDLKFKEQVSTYSKNIENNRKAIVVVRKRSQEEEMKYEEKRKDSEEKNLLETVGLSLILREVSNSKKLIIGHNMILDIMFIIRQFFEPLPDDYNKFKQLTHKIFPNIIDTKFVSTSQNFKELFKSSVLEYLMKKIVEPPFEATKIEWTNIFHAYSLTKAKDHEAGYDAFITGYLFITLMKYLKLDLKELNQELYKCTVIRPFLNRIALQCAIIPYIYLIGKEPNESRDHVFYIKFPSTWRTSDIQENFKNYGPIYVNWLNNTAAFVSLQNREHSSIVTKTITRHAGFEIMTLKQYMNISSSPISPDIKKRRFNSESSDVGKQSSSDKHDKNSRKKQKKLFKDDDSW